MEQYFSNKQGSPGDTSLKIDLSASDENNTIAQLQNQQHNLNTSKETETTNTFQNNVTGE